MRVQRPTPEPHALVPVMQSEVMPEVAQPAFELGGTSISRGLAEDIQVADLLAKSGFFPNVKTVAEAFTKLRLGREIGIGQVTALRELYVIQGRLAMSATLMATLIQRSGIYDFRVERLDPEGCCIAFFKGGEFLGRSEFSMIDARKAGLEGKDNWKKYPKNMLWSRALSNGARWYCSGVFLGAVYEVSELSEAEDGN